MASDAGRKPTFTQGSRSTKHFCAAGTQRTSFAIAVTDIQSAGGHILVGVATLVPS